MANCYLCDEILVGENVSYEHIFPNAIGGKLKSKALLCKNCNSYCGLQIDSTFSRFIPDLLSKYNIRRDRGETADFIATEIETGEELIVSPGLKIAYRQPRLEDNGNSVTVSAHNIKRARQEIEKWKKYQGARKIILEEIISKSLPKKLDFVYSRVIEPDLIIRAIAKIIVNYYIYKTEDKTLCAPIISFLKEDMENRFGWFFDLDICKNIHQGKPKHVLIIKGDRKGKAIYGYVELFGEVGFVVLVNGRYIGEDFQMDYTFDIVNNEEEDYNYNFALTVGNIIDIILAKPEARIVKKLDVVNTVNPGHT